MDKTDNANMPPRVVLTALRSFRAIRSKADYEAALARADELMDAEAGTEEADESDVLSALLDAYEDKHYPADPPPPKPDVKPDGHGSASFPPWTFYLIDDPGSFAPVEAWEEHLRHLRTLAQNSPQVHRMIANALGTIHWIKTRRHTCVPAPAGAATPKKAC